MDFKDIFKSFMGIGSNRHRQPFHDGDDRSEVNPPQFFGDVGDMMGEMEQMFQSFDEMFRNMGIGQIPHHPNNGFIFQHPGEKDRETPRDHMLKEPGSSDIKPNNPTKGWDMIPRFQPRTLEKKDTDLDEEVSKRGLGSLFESPESRLDMPPQPRSYYKSISIRTIRTPDGKILQEKTVRDQNGREETTVTTTEPSNRDGEIEVLPSLPQGDGRHFGGMWTFSDIFGNGSQREHHEEELNPFKENLDHGRSGIFRNLFGNFFEDKKKS